MGAFDELLSEMSESETRSEPVKEADPEQDLDLPLPPPPKDFPTEVGRTPSKSSLPDEIKEEAERIDLEKEVNQANADE